MKKWVFILAKWVFILGVLGLSWSSLAAQEKLEIFGYYESQAMGTGLQGEFYQLFTNKLRVDLKSDFSDNITFAANFDYIHYLGKTEWNVLDFLSDDVTSTIPEDMQSLYIIAFSNDTFLDNAYMKFSFKPFDLTLGKQQISLGTGYVWNPTDVFNIKDVLDPTYEQPGHTALRLDIPLSPAYTLTALYAPEETWEKSTKLLQLKGAISHFDYNIIAVERVWPFHDYTEFDTEYMNFVDVSEKRKMLGGSTVGELLGLGVWAEYAYNWMEKSGDFYELVVGADYTFDFQTYVMMEYYRNTLGKSDYKDYDINDWMRFLAAEQKAICRDQAYIFAQHPATDLLNVGLQTIYCFSDNSVAFVPTLIYSLSDNVDVYAYLNFNLGKESTVYGKNMGNGGLIRLRAYF
ncbi:MAG: hypothetical protein KAT01_05365 [Candidatus Aminicenantes bacterium]|nr:hypothetical protein [Candidatus Aminicenantes bacterium]